MKLTHFIAAGLLMAGIGVSSEASAQRWDGYSEYRGDRGWDRRDDRRWDRRSDRRWDRGRHRGWDKRYNRGRHYGWRNGRGDCRTVWRYGERYRICR